MWSPRGRRPLWLWVLGVVVLPWRLYAADGTWTNLAGGSWPTGGNWASGTVADGTGFTADFSTLDLTADATVSLDGARTIGHLKFGDTATTTYNWFLNPGSGGPLTLSVSSGASTVLVNNGTTTIGAEIAGTGNVDKAGSGVLVLSASNSFSGAMTVRGGVLRVADNGALGATNGGTVVSGTGAGVELSDGITIMGERITINGTGPSSPSPGVNLGALQAGNGAAATWGGDILLGTTGSRLGAQAGGTLTVLGVIDDGANTFTLAISAHTNGGTVVLGNQSTYGGGTDIVRGTLRLGTNDALPAGTTLDLHSAGSERTTFDMAGFDQRVGGLKRTVESFGTITNSGATLSTLTVSNAVAAFSFGGEIVGNVAVVKVGGGNLTLSGSNTFTGGTAVGDGSLILAGGHNRLAANSAATLGSGGSSGRLQLGDGTAAISQTLTGLFTSGSGTENRVVGGNGATASTLVLNVGSGVAQSFGGMLGGTNATENNLALTKTGAGTLTLSASNSYKGATAVNAGILRVSDGAALGAADGATVVGSDGTVQLTDGVTVAGESITINGGGDNFRGTLSVLSGAGATWAGGVVIGTSGARIGAQANGTLTVSGVIDDGPGTNSLAISADPNNGVVVLSARNTYDGGTDIVRGTLRLGTNDALPTGTTLDVHQLGTGDPGIFDLAGFNQTVAGLKRGNVTGAGTVTNSASGLGMLTVSNVAADFVYDGTLRGNVALVKVGASNLTLSGANTASGGTTVGEGTLILAGGDNRLAANSAVTLGSGTSSGRLQLGDGTAAISQTLTGLFTSGSGTDNRVVGGNGAAASTLVMDIGSGVEQSLGDVLGGAGATENQLALTKTGAGTLALTASNAISGAVTVSAGILRVDNDGALGATSAGTTAGSGGTLQLSDGIWVSGETITVNGNGDNARGGLQAASGASATWAGDVVIGSAARIGAQANGALAVTGVIDDGAATNALRISADQSGGVVVLSGQSTYGGPTEILRGTLRLGTNDALPTTSILNVQSTNLSELAVFDLAGFDQRVGGLTRSASGWAGVVTNSAATTSTLTVSNASASSYGGFIGGDVALVKAGAGTLTLSTQNTYSGATTIQGGILRIEHAGALGTAGGPTTVANGTLQLGDGVIVSAESVTINGNGDNARGALQAGSAATATWAGGVVIGSGGARIGARDNGSLTVSGVIDDGANTYSLGISADANGGVVTLANQGTYGGGTTLYRGTLRLGTNDALPTATVLTMGGAGDALSFDLGGYSQGVAGLSESSGPSKVVTNSGASLSVLTVSNVNNYVYGGTIDGNIALVKSGSGTQSLTNQNTYTGSTTIGGGILQLGHAGALGATNGGTIASGGTLQLSDGVSVGGETVTINGNGASNLGALQAASGAAATWAGEVVLGSDLARIGAQSGGALTVSGVIDDGANSYGLDISANQSSGVVVLSGKSTYGGRTGIVRGTLRLGTNDALPTGTTLNINSFGIGEAATFDMAGFNQTVGGLDRAGSLGSGILTNGQAGLSILTVSNTAADFTYSGVIGGNVALAKTGERRLALTGTNTYTGPTTVAGGSLLINGDNGAATGLVRVISGSLLGGSGTVGGQTIFESGSTHSPGNSPGLQTFAGGLVYSNGATLVWELNTNGNALVLRGVTTGYDGVNLTNGQLLVENGAAMSLSFDGAGSAVDWGDAFWSSNREWLVISFLDGTADYASGSTNFTLNAASEWLDKDGDLLAANPWNSAAGFVTFLQADGVYLQYQVPEPCAWVALVAAGGMVAGLRRRSFKFHD